MNEFVPTKPHPFDFDMLHKGMTIEAEELEAVTGEQPASHNYSFALLGLRDKIERELRARGRPASVKILGATLRILTDEEASEFNHRRFIANLRGTERRFLQLTEVDRKSLTDKQCDAHDRRTEVAGHFYQAIATAGKQIALEAHRRRIPGLPPAKENPEPES